MALLCMSRPTSGECVGGWAVMGTASGLVVDPAWEALPPALCLRRGGILALSPAACGALNPGVNPGVNPDCLLGCKASARNWQHCRSYTEHLTEFYWGY